VIFLATAPGTGFGRALAWVIFAGIVLVAAIDFALMVRRSRRWRDVEREQRGAQLRREWRGR